MRLVTFLQSSIHLDIHILDLKLYVQHTYQFNFFIINVIYYNNEYQ